MRKTAFLHDERTFWHGGGHYVLTIPAGGLVQPGGQLPESPETKRRLLNLMAVTGLLDTLDHGSAAPASEEELRRVHPAHYLDAFKAESDADGGNLGLRTPFLKGGYEIAALSAGLVTEALRKVLKGDADRAYALSRPPGHHCLPDWPNGFCLLANIAIAIHAAKAEGRATRFAVVDWDVHHGNGTEAIFLNDPDVLTISIHQENNYPLDTGGADVRGVADSNLNIPLPPGCGHATYIEAMERLVIPAIRQHAPEVIIVACGYDASAVDPIAQMLLGAEAFGQMTDLLGALADDICDGRLVLAHEGGYSELHVPFCGHATIATLAGSQIAAPDPLRDTIRARQPASRWVNHVSAWLKELATNRGFQTNK